MFPEAKLYRYNWAVSYQTSYLPNAKFYSNWPVEYLRDIAAILNSA